MGARVHLICHWGGNEVSLCLGAGVYLAVSCGGHGQWVGSRGLCCLPGAAENRLLPWPLSAVSLMKVENFWLLNGSCGCWKIKRLCLKCRSSWRPMRLRRAVEKNVCLTVTRFAYSTVSWEGRLTRGKNHPLFLLRTFWAVEIFRSGCFPSCLLAQFHSSPFGTPPLKNHQWFPNSHHHCSKLFSPVKLGRGSPSPPGGPSLALTAFFPLSIQSPRESMKELL